MTKFIETSEYMSDLNDKANDYPHGLYSCPHVKPRVHQNILKKFWKVGHPFRLSRKLAEQCFIVSTKKERHVIIRLWNTGCYDLSDAVFDVVIHGANQHPKMLTDYKD